MDYITSDVLEGFRDELKKHAGYFDVIKNPRVASALGLGGAMGGVGVGAGALVGAGVKGYRGYKDAKEQGADTRSALSAGLTSGAKGAVVGAGVGALGGKLLGAGAGAIAPEMAEKARVALTNTKGVNTFANFGQRQIHGLTGATPKEGLGSIGMGAAPRLKGWNDAERAAASADKSIGKSFEEAKIEPPSGFMGFNKKSPKDLIDQLHVDKLRAQAADQGKSYMAGHAAEEAGLTSLPGVIRGLSTPGQRLDTLKKTLGDQWHGTSPAMKALTIGMPIADLAINASSEDDGTGSRARHIGSSLAGAVGGTLLSPLPMGSQMLLGTGLNAAGGALGGAVDKVQKKIRGVLPPPGYPAPEGT